MRLRRVLVPVGAGLIALGLRRSGRTDATVETRVCAVCRAEEEGGSGELRRVLDNGSTLVLCDVCLARGLRRQDLSGVARMMVAAVLGSMVVGLAVQLVARTGRQAEPPSLVDTLRGAHDFLNFPGMDVGEAIAFLSVVAAISIAVAVVLERSSARAADLATVVERGGLYDLRIARELLRIESFSTLQMLVGLVLTVMCGGLALSLVRGHASEVPVGALAMVIAAWTFTECLRLERVTQVAWTARERMRSGEVAVVGGRQAAAAAASWRAGWVWVLLLPTVSGLAVVAATWPAGSNSGDGPDHMSLIWQTAIAIVVGAAVGVAGILLPASLALSMQSRWMSFCFVGILVLVWILSSVETAARVGLVTHPDEGRFIAGVVAFAGLWVFAAVGACGAGPMRSLARFALPVARLQNWFEKYAEGRRRGADGVLGGQHSARRQAGGPSSTPTVLEETSKGRR